MMRPGEEKLEQILLNPHSMNEQEQAAGRTHGYRETIARLGEEISMLQRALVEAELRMRLYEAVISSTPDLVYVFDLNYRFAFANEALLRMWGRNLEESVGKSLLEIGYEPWHAEMHEREIDRVIATREPVRGEVSFPHATLGRRIYDYIFVPVLNAQGGVEAIAGTTRDITDLKLADEALYRSEERARLAVETARLGTWRYDLETDLVHLDPRMRTMWGEPEDVVTVPLAAAIARIHPDDRTDVTNAISGALSPQSDGHYAIDYRIVWADNTVRWISANGQVRFDGAGPGRRAIGFLGTALDITDRKLAEEALRAAVQEAKAANKTKSDFLAAMSHELRTPLNAITGYTQLLQVGIHGALTPKQRESLARIEHNGQHLLALINDILNFAKLEAGRVEFRLEDLQLAEVVDQLMPMVERQLEARGLTHSVRIDPRIRVHADRDKVEQILLNLLSNAIKFTEPGGNISVVANVCDGCPSERVCLVVTDTGCGIPADHLEAIFDPFVQAHRRLTRPTEGTGLGLAISRDLANGMGCELKVRSVEGQGSAFTLVLPLASADAA